MQFIASASVPAIYMVFLPPAPLCQPSPAVPPCPFPAFLQPTPTLLLFCTAFHSNLVHFLGYFSRRSWTCTMLMASITCCCGLVYNSIFRSIAGMYVVQISFALVLHGLTHLLQTISGLCITWGMGDAPFHPILKCDKNLDECLSKDTKKFQ